MIEFLNLHYNPVQGSTGALQGNPCNDYRIPAMRTGFPVMKTGFSLLGIGLQGKAVNPTGLGLQCSCEVFKGGYKIRKVLTLVRGINNNCLPGVAGIPTL